MTTPPTKVPRHHPLARHARAASVVGPAGRVRRTPATRRPTRRPTRPAATQTVTTTPRTPTPRTTPRARPVAGAAGVEARADAAAGEAPRTPVSPTRRSLLVRTAMRTPTSPRRAAPTRTGRPALFVAVAGATAAARTARRASRDGPARRSPVSGDRLDWKPSASAVAKDARPVGDAPSSLRPSSSP